MVTVQKYPRLIGRADSPTGYVDLEVIVERLRRRHPELNLTEIRTVVDDAAKAFEGVRLQHFVPLLVEKTARDECRRLSHTLDPSIQLQDRSLRKC